MTRDTNKQIEELQRSLEEARKRNNELLDRGLESGKRLEDACESVGRSSSDSWAGWHSRMYYEDFQQPPAIETWDTEWGGTDGIPPKWNDHTADEIKGEIESRAGSTLQELKGITDTVQEDCQNLQQEVLTVLSPICDLASLESEKELLKEIEGLVWVHSTASLINAALPTVISRDSGAVSQGLRPPIHLNVRAAVSSNTSTLTTCRDFLSDSIRLCRQIQTKIDAHKKNLPATERTTRGESAEVHTLERKLRQRNVALFIVAALITVGAALYVRLAIDMTQLIAAAVIVASALIIALLYAILINREHAGKALAGASVTAGAVIAVDEILARLVS